MKSNPICPYCVQFAQLNTGKYIYPHRQDLYKLKFWHCKPCNAYVGTHKGTDIPLGRLADEQLRHWKKETHKVFDPHWRNTDMKRKEAYRWLADKLDIKVDHCHIGWFDIETCKRVIEVCNEP